MMPLTMAKIGEVNLIKKVGGKEETRKFLEKLGFVTGGIVTVVSEISGNMIVNVKESRIAIGKDMANKIMIWFERRAHLKIVIYGYVMKWGLTLKS